jgi:hypothetical protein
MNIYSLVAGGLAWVYLVDDTTCTDSNIFRYIYYVANELDVYGHNALVA